VSKTARLFKTRLAQVGTETEPGQIIHAVAAPRGGSWEADVREGRPQCTNRYELVRIVSGKALIALPNREVELKAGDLLLIGKGVEYTETWADPPRPYELFRCSLHRNLALLSQTTGTHPSAFHTLGPLELTGRADLESIAAAMSCELAGREWGWESSVRGLLRYLVSILVRRLERNGTLELGLAESPTVKADQHSWGIIHSVLEYCETNYRRQVSLREVADAVGYSPSYVSRLVSRHLGRSLSDHLRELRMATARHLLESPDTSVRDVSQALGYTDPAHFSRAFSRALGLSPQSYRRRLGGL
jgi:AraC-like DNA-binding protein